MREPSRPASHAREVGAGARQPAAPRRPRAGRHDRPAGPPLAHRADGPRHRHRHRRDGRGRRDLGVQPGRRPRPARRARHRHAARGARTDGVRRRRRRCPSRRAPSPTGSAPVTSAAGLTSVDATVRRNDHIGESITGGISVVAADTGVLDAVSGRARRGRFLDDASSQVPTVVLGADAAGRLGIHSVDPAPRVWISGQWFVVIGILERAPLAPEIDGAALIGYPVAEELFEHHDVAVDAVRAHGARPGRGGPRRARRRRSARTPPARSTCPGRPTPSQARATTDAALRNLLLALGAVALVVGGVGITNVMVISVLERRSEIGVRRALGARRIHVAGAVPRRGRPCWRCSAGSAAPSSAPLVTALYARSQGWLVDVPDRRPRRRRRRRPRRRACWPASPPPCAPPASTPPTRSARTDDPVTAQVLGDSCGDAACAGVSRRRSRRCPSAPSSRRPCRRVVWYRLVSFCGW